MSVVKAGRSDFGKAALEHLDALYGYAIALARDPTEAEDLVQETYLRAVRAYAQLRPSSNLKSWLFTIMRNIWLNQLRHARSGPQFVELDSELRKSSESCDRVTDDPSAAYEREAVREMVRFAIESLPRLYREVLVLRDIEGFSYRQIVEILGCPPGTVMSRLGRAREKLRRALGDGETRAAARAMRARES